MNARFYVPSIGRFASADTIVPDPMKPQAYNRYSYVYNSPAKYVDPSGHSCVDALQGYPAEEYDCVQEGSDVLIFYLNGLGGQESYLRNDNASNEYNFSLHVLSMAFGEENVVHIPLFTSPYRRGWSHLDMIAEAYGIETSQTEFATTFIEQYLTDNEINDGTQIVLVGSSAGGTIAIETLDQLAEKDISVAQVVLRGSFVRELSIQNTNRVDYIIAEDPWSDRNYSFDINPFDSVNVKEHRIRGFEGHVPQSSQQQRQIAGLIVDLITDGSIAK